MHDVMRTCLAVLFGLALTATGLWAAAAEEEPAAAMEKEMVLDPTTGKITVVLKLPAGEYFQRFGVAMARLATL